MPIAPPEAWLPVYNWLQRNYPRPGINKDWLKACVDALQAQALAEGGAPLNGPDLFRAAETQLLLSHLSASCLPNTGLPAGDEEVHDVVLFPTANNDAKRGMQSAISPGGCLVMVLRVDEVGASAFSLQTTMQQRREVISGAGRIRRLRDPGVGGGVGQGARNGRDRGDGGYGGDDGSGDEYDDDPGRLPAYPRGMLVLEVTDGHTVMRAMEYKRIPGLVLGETMLGSKIILRNVRVLRNILQLTPECVTLKGHCVEELEAVQGRLFENGLRRRMGKDELPLDEEGEAAAEGGAVEAAEAAPVPAAARAPRRPAQALEGVEAFLNAEDFLDIDDDLDDVGDSPRQNPRQPSRQAAHPAQDAPPPPKKRLTLPPRLAIDGHVNAEAGPSTGRRTRTSAPPIETDDDFSLLEPTAEEMEEIMRLEGTATARTDQKGAIVAKELPPTDPPSQSKYFGKGTSKSKQTGGAMAHERGLTDEDIDMDAGMNAIATRRRQASRNQGNGRTPLFMTASQIDSDAEEDSQKENRPVPHQGGEPPLPRAQSRGGAAGRKGAEGDREYREVIELSD